MDEITAPERGGIERIISDEPDRYIGLAEDDGAHVEEEDDRESLLPAFVSL